MRVRERELVSTLAEICFIKFVNGSTLQALNDMQTAHLASCHQIPRFLKETESRKNKLESLFLVYISNNIVLNFHKQF